MSAAISTSLLPRWLKRSLVAIAALLLVLLSIVFVTLALLQVSPERFEVVIEKVSSRFLGRELQIGQLLEVELGADTYLLARNVSLANPDWADIPEFATVGRLSIRINVPSIWRDGPVIIRQLELSDVSLALIDSEALPATWEFLPGDEDEEVAENQGEVRLKPEVIFPVVFSEAHVSNGEIIYRDSERDVRMQIEALALQEPHRGDQISLDLKGDINEVPLQVRGQAGPLEALITGTNLNLDLELVWGEFEMQGRGSIGDLLNLADPDVYLKISAPQSRPLLDALGMAKLRDGPLQFEGHITSANPGIAVESTGSFDEFNFELAGKLSRPLSFDGVEMTIKLQGPSLAEAGSLFDIDDLPDLGYQASGAFYRDGASLGVKEMRLNIGEASMIVDGSLPNFPELDGWKVKLEGERLNFALLGPLLDVESLPSTLYNFNADLASTDGGSKLVNLTIHSPVSKFDISSKIGKAPGFLGSQIKLKFVGQNMSITGAWLGLHDLPVQAFEASADLTLGEAGWKLGNGVFTSAGLQLGLSGEIDKFPEPSSLAVKIAVDSPDLASLLQIYGFEWEGLPAFPASLNGTISGSSDRLTIDQAEAEFGNSKLVVSGAIGDPLLLNDLDLAVAIASPDLLQVLPVVSTAAWPALAVDASGQISSSPDGLVIKDLKGNFGGAQGSLTAVLNVEPPYSNSRVELSADGPDLSAVLGPWLEHEIPADPFTIELDADFPDGGLRIRQLDARVGDNFLSGQIEVDQWGDPGNGNGHLELHGASSANLAKTLGYNLVLPDTDYALNVVVKRSPDWVRFNPVTLNLGKSDYAGRVDIRPGDIPVVNVDLHSKYINLSYLLPDMENLAEGEAAAVRKPGVVEESVLSEALTPDDMVERLVPDEPLDFNWLNQFQASIKYKADQIHVREDVTSSAAIDISIADGVLSGRQLSWDGNFVRGDAQLQITALEEGADVDVYFDMTRIPVILLLGGEPEYRDDSLYRAQIHTSGASLQQLAEKSNGVILFKGGGGRLDNKGIDLVMGDVFEEIFSRINPFSETDPYTEVICHAGAMRIHDGMMDVAPGVVLRTTKIDIATGGSIDLSNEALDMAFDTRGRQGIGISASKAVTPYFKIGGSLANPRLAVDRKGVAVSGSAAIATAGLSIVAEGLWDRWVVTAKNPCDTLLTKASDENLEIYQAILDKPSLRDEPVVEMPEN